MSRQWVQPPVLHAEPGAGPVVCARWCPTLPHPGGCSTIGAVRLSFRVRDGYRAFPCRCDHRDDYVGSASVCSCDSVIGPPLNPHTRLRVVCVVGRGGLGVDRIVDASRLPYRSPPVLGGVVVCVGLLVPVSSKTVTGLPLLAYQPSSLLGAYQKGQVLLVETLS